MTTRSVLLLIGVFAVLAAAKPHWSELDSYSFAQYVQDFNKSYTGAEYVFRESLFNSKQQSIISHNKDTTKSWKENVNHLTDWTVDEFKGLLGSKKGLLFRDKAVDDVKVVLTSVNLPANVDWRKKGVISPVKNQGQCGSCWTFGTTETVESFWALAKGQLPILSEQQIVDCTPNPNDCGGTGGCGGGTPELAMAQIIKMGGMTTEAAYPYTAEDGTCKFSGNVPNPSATIRSYKVLPSNQQPPVEDAVANIGPMIINVDASSWGAYGGGVYDGCDQTNPDIDHVVQLAGYGVDPSYGPYWLVRNSWGPDWGESGYIRLKKETTPRCGTDTQPSDGTGCNGGPPSVTVCGTCGILYDVSYPVV